jgi:hypothetical protein
MRTSRWVFTLAARGSLAAVVGLACGGSTQASPPVDASLADAGKDATSTPPSVDGSPDAEGDACAITLSLSTLAPADASIAGDASVGTCLPCARTACASAVATCDDDCACKSALVAFFTCAIAKKPLASCAGDVLGESNALALGACILGMCSAECGTGGFGKDASSGDSGQEGHEAGQADGASESD